MSLIKIKHSMCYINNVKISLIHLADAHCSYYRNVLRHLILYWFYLSSKFILTGYMCVRSYRHRLRYSKTCLIWTPMGLKNCFHFKEVFGLHRFKLHRQVVEGIVKSVWFMQVFGLLRVRFHCIAFLVSDSCRSTIKKNGNHISADVT
jgi:hypothetical protein